MQEKTTILNLIEKHPKHFSKMVKKDSALTTWVMTHTLVNDTPSFSEMIYSALYQQNATCAAGKDKKFKSITDGYGFCGLTRTCQCAQTQIGKKISEIKSAYSDVQKHETNSKRSTTNLQKYGVSNTGQTETAKQSHREFYNSEFNVQAVISQMQQTCLARYGVSNPAHNESSIEKTKHTLLERYNVSNISQIPSTKDKLRARIRIQTEEGLYRNAGYHKFSNYVLEKYNVTLITPIDEYLLDKNNLNFECLTCNTPFNKKFYYSLGVLCETCYPRMPQYTSKEEQSIFDYISIELGITGHQSDRSIINPHELDMVFPKYNIAVEYGGLYWHSEASSGRGRLYHQQKLKLATQKGYRLITIFSDEWLKTPEIVKSKLRSIFQQTGKVHARKCTSSVITQNESKQFMNKYHLQGHSSHSIAVGLKNIDGDLLAVMTFANGRVALNTKNVDGEYELVRFATNGCTIVGGASKLLTFFEKTCQPTKLVSYADLRWSQGNVYEKLGFSLSGEPTIGYWYVEKYLTRYHRYNFRKSILVKEGADITLTEWQIMQSLGYDRIWDCGHAKYVKNYCV